MPKSNTYVGNRFRTFSEVLEVRSSIEFAVTGHILVVDISPGILELNARIRSVEKSFIRLESKRALFSSPDFSVVKHLCSFYWGIGRNLSQDSERTDLG